MLEDDCLTAANMVPYIILICLWVGWCFLHSALIAKTVAGYLQVRLGKRAAYYRLFYNGTALVMLMPILAYTLSVNGSPVFCWQGGFRFIQGVLLVSALFLFAGGAKRYDMAQFFGFKQIHENRTCKALTDDCQLNMSGILNVVRHPWYAGGILLVWARNLNTPAIIVNLIISGYFIIGAVLEEKKLVAEYGTEYRAYQQRVSMLVPIKWVLKRWK